MKRHPDAARRSIPDHEYVAGAADWSRRRFLRTAMSATIAAGVTLPGGPTSWLTSASTSRADDVQHGGDGDRHETVRFVHFSDVHLRPDLDAAKGLRLAFETAQSLTPRPSFVLFGGDMVHSVRSLDEANAKQRFNLFKYVLADCDLPARYCVGNHDVFGWSARSNVPETHAMYGKRMLQDALTLPKTNHAFDAGAWRIYVVDDVLPFRSPEGDRGYQGGFTEETLAWLDTELAAAGDRPKMICTHIPIVSAAVMSYLADTQQTTHALKTSLVVRNPKSMLDLLAKYKVKLVLTGHLHQRERITYEHTTFVGQGAVCGQWWQGTNRLTAEGFGVIDLHTDGQFDERYHVYGWTSPKQATASPILRSSRDVLAYADAEV